MFQTVVIENLWPQINGGLYPIKRTPGDEVLQSHHDLVCRLLLEKKKNPDVSSRSFLQ